jgi:hypothetical protein
MLVRRWWICRYFLTSSVGCGGSWSNAARGCPLVDVPQRHVPCCMQRVHRLTKPHWRWCFFGSGNGGCSTSLSMFVLAMLESGGGR